MLVCARLRVTNTADTTFMIFLGAYTEEWLVEVCVKFWLIHWYSRKPILNGLRNLGNAINRGDG